MGRDSQVLRVLQTENSRHHCQDQGMLNNRPKQHLTLHTRVLRRGRGIRHLPGLLSPMGS